MTFDRYGRIAHWPAALAVVALNGCALESSPEEVGSVQQAVSSYFRNLAIEVKDCKEVHVSFDRVLTFNNSPVTQLTLMRDGKFVHKIPPNGLTTPTVTIGDVWFMPDTDRHHRYSVVVENAMGEKGESAVLTHTASGCEPFEPSFVIVKVKPDDLGAPHPYSSDGVLQQFFTDPDNPGSAALFFGEVSYGKAEVQYSEHPGWVNLGMTHREFCKGSIDTSSGYAQCGKADSLWSEVSSGLRDDMDEIYGEQQDVVWVVHGMRGGASSYKGDVVAGGADTLRGDLRTIFHETGHHFVMSEAFHVQCDADFTFPYPERLLEIPLERERTSGKCGFSRYGTHYDPMGHSGTHYYAMHKLQAGWLSYWRNVKTLGPIAPGRSSNITLRAGDEPNLVDGVTDHRQLLVQLENNGDSYMGFEYRRPVGVNAVRYPDQLPMVEGIYASYWPGHNPTDRVYEGGFSSDHVGDVLLPQLERGIARAGIPYIDPYRGLVVSLQSTDASTSQATFNVARYHAYSGTCRAARDTVNYVVEGRPCFCNHQVGEFIRESVDTVQCNTPYLEWEFADASDEQDFEEVLTDIAPSNWQVSSGNFTQWNNVPRNMVVSSSMPNEACVQTTVRTSDDDASGIVFHYESPNEYYVFELSDQSNYARIVRVRSGAARTLASTTWSGTWESTRKLEVCFKGRKVHAFDQGALLFELTEAAGDGRVGLYNSQNQGARHAYLRVRPYREYREYRE